MSPREGRSEDEHSNDDGSESGRESAASVKSGIGSDAGSSDEKVTTKADKDLTLYEILERKARCPTVLDILKDEEEFKRPAKVILSEIDLLVSSEDGSVGGESDVWTEYGEEVVEDKTGKDRVYTKWKPPRNKLTQEIQRKKGAKRKSITDSAETRRQSKVDSAMTAVSAGPGKSASQIYFYDWSDNYRRVIKELKAAEAQKTRSGSISTLSNFSTQSSTESGTRPRGQRKYGTSKRPSILTGGTLEKPKATERAPPPKKELQKSTPKIAKEFIDNRWPKNMFDNMSGFWRMQCAEDDFRITPKNYSLYLDPQQREKDLKISWNTYVAAKEKCMKWLYDYNEHFNN